MDAEKKTLYLTVGKEVSLSFTGNGEALQYIRLSVNKLAEIINNGLVDRQSIFEIDEVSLITKSNYKTVVQVVAGKQVLHGNTDHVDVVIDKDKTKQKVAGKIFSRMATFYLSLIKNNTYRNKSCIRSI